MTPLDRPATVVGAGRSGVAAANLLASQSIDVLLVEAREDAERPAGLDPAVAFRAGSNQVRQGDIAVLSPGIPEVSPVREAVAAVASEVIGEVELFYRLCPSPIVAITGTDGKSTTTTMIGEVFDGAGLEPFVGGNLGNPLCEGVLDLNPERWVVAEVSAFQLTTCDRFRPRIAVVTNIAEDHLDYHGGFAPYQAAKQRIWDAMQSGDVVIVNHDDPYIRAWTLPEHPTIRRFSLDPASGADAWPRDGKLWIETEEGPEPFMERSELKLLGPHNVANALATALAAQAAGVPLHKIASGLASYAPLPHRLEPLSTVGGVRWINDSKATNPNAATAGLSALDGPVILLAGGSSKDADFSRFAQTIRDRTRAAILFGATRETLREAIGGDHLVQVVETLEEAVDAARALSEPGDTVLLGPACASFDQFRSYGHRGDTFRELVRTLPEALSLP